MNANANAMAMKVLKLAFWDYERLTGFSRLSEYKEVQLRISAGGDSTQSPQIVPRSFPPIAPIP